MEVKRSLADVGSGDPVILLAYGAFMMEDKTIVRCENGKGAPFPTALTKLSDRQIAREPRGNAENISRARKEESARRKTRVKLMRFTKTLNKS